MTHQLGSPTFKIQINKNQNVLSELEKENCLIELDNHISMAVISNAFFKIKKWESSSFRHYL